MTSSLQVESLLKQYCDPHLGQDWITAKCVKSIEVKDQQIFLKVELGYPNAGIQKQQIQQIQALLRPLSNSQEIIVNLSVRIRAHAVQPGLRGLDNIKNIIAVGSGKGGVGKSTTAVNLAIALAQEGARVGLLDADIYGPNIPQMLGTVNPLEILPEKKFIPVVTHGIQAISMGYLVDKDTPMIWRGPMVSAALEQLMRDTLWESLDYLIIDLPPGTGDIQLTLAKKIPVSGALIVTTPQTVALLDARKALEMFKKVNVPILGVVENMATFHCEQCGYENSLFGKEGGLQMAKTCEVPLLGKIPLVRNIREQADLGQPIVIAQPDTAIAVNYRVIARNLAAQLALRGIDNAKRFPKVVVE